MLPSARMMVEKPVLVMAPRKMIRPYTTAYGAIVSVAQRRAIPRGFQAPRVSGHRRTDVLDVEVILFRPVDQVQDIRNLGGQQFGHLFAQVMYAKAVQEAVDRVLFGFFDGLFQVGG